MRLVIQRVSKSNVKVDEKIVGEIGKGPASNRTSEPDKKLAGQGL